MMECSAGKLEYIKLEKAGTILSKYSPQRQNQTAVIELCFAVISSMEMVMLHTDYEPYAH